MKVTHVLTCALVATGLAVSAASIEQIFNISVIGNYQGLSVTNGVLVHDRHALARILSVNVVNALAIDHNTNILIGTNLLNGTNFLNGTLIYKTALDGSSTNVVIRQRGKTNELDVTDAFTFATGPFVVDQVANTNTLFTNSYMETGLRSFSFTSSSVSFTNIGLANGTLRRTGKISANIHGTVFSGFADLLNYTAGSGSFSMNTNIFYFTNFQFAATNFVTGPATVSFSTFSPLISPN